MAGDIGWVGLEERALLRVEGPDARDLLQGLVSNDLGRLAPDRALHAARPPRRLTSSTAARIRSGVAGASRSGKTR